MKATDAENYREITSTEIFTNEGIVSVSYITKASPGTVLLRSFLKDDAVVPDTGIVVNKVGARLVPTAGDIKSVKSASLSEFLNSVKSPTKAAINAAFVSAGLTATPADNGSGGGGSSGSAGGATGPRADLQNFLAEHLGLYFDPDLAPKKKNQQQTAATIINGDWGDASDAGLAMFVKKIRARIPGSAVTTFTGKDPITTSDIEWLSDTDTAKPEDLQFAWVATRPVGKSGFAAAAEIGFDTTIPAGFFAEDGTPLRKLYDMLALSPAPFVVVTTPIPADSKIITTAGDTKNIVPFQTDFPSGAILGIGINPTDSAQVYATGEQLNTDVHGEVAKAVLAGGGVTMQLILANGKTYPAIGEIKIGKSVTFGNPATTTATAGPAAASAPDAMSLSGESRLQMNTSLGVTVGGTRPGFILENVYMKNNNTPAMNSPQVVLQKRTGGRGDVFELSVSSVSSTDILIPIIVKPTLSEAVEHWTEKVLSALTTTANTAATGIPHVALKQITWGYDEHFKNFGLDDPGNIRLIAYEPADPGSYPKDVNVISVAEALQRGSTTESKWDPIDFAIAKYVAGYDNLVGTRLYTSSQLNRTMNSFPLAQFRNG